MRSSTQAGSPVWPAYSMTMPIPFIRSSSLIEPRIQTPGWFISTTASTRSATPSGQDIHGSLRGNRIAVHGDHFEFVSGQRERNIVGRAGIEQAQQHALPLLHADRIAVPERLVVDRAVLVGDFPAVVRGPEVRERRSPVMRGQENFLIVISRLALRLDVEESELAVERAPYRDFPWTACACDTSATRPAPAQMCTGGCRARGRAAFLLPRSRPRRKRRIVRASGQVPACPCHCARPR